jgi:polyphosphate kinase 2 (PPK2 family)
MKGMALKSDGSIQDEGRAKAAHAKGRMQRKLCRLQDWAKETGVRIIILFERRDAADKGGTIKAITERVSPVGAF